MRAWALSFLRSRVTDSLLGLTMTLPVGPKLNRFLRNVNPLLSLTMRVFLRLMEMPRSSQSISMHARTSLRCS